MNSLTLYELTGQAHDLQELAKDGSIPEDALQATLDGLTGEIQAKATNIAFVIKNFEATEEAIGNAIEGMERRKKAIKNRREWLAEYVKINLEKLGISVECAEFKLSVRKNPVAVEVIDGESIPDQFWIQPDPPPRQLDKKALKEYLETLPDKSCEGARLIQRTRLSIE